MSTFSNSNPQDSNNSTSAPRAGDTSFPLDSSNSAQSAHSTPNTQQPASLSLTSTHQLLESLLDKIFSEENKRQAPSQRYSNKHYLEKNNYDFKRFMNLESELGLKIPLLRYSLITLPKLLKAEAEAYKQRFNRNDSKPSSARRFVAPQLIKTNQISADVQDSIDSTEQLVSSFHRFDKRARSNAVQPNWLDVNEGEPLLAFPKTPLPLPINTQALDNRARKGDLLCATDYFKVSDTELTPHLNGDCVYFRFVITGFNQRVSEALFSLCYSPDASDSHKYMSHSQLVSEQEKALSECLAAGVIGFKFESNGSWSVCYLSNKTGHYQCPDYSLYLAIKMAHDTFGLGINGDPSLKICIKTNNETKNGEVYSVPRSLLVNKLYPNLFSSSACCTPSPKASSRRSGPFFFAPAPLERTEPQTVFVTTPTATSEDELVITTPRP